MKLKYVGSFNAIDLPTLGIWKWAQGEVREINEETATELLLQSGNFEVVKEEQDKPDRKKKEAD